MSGICGPAESPPLESLRDYVHGTSKALTHCSLIFSQLCNEHHAMVA